MLLKTLFFSLVLCCFFQIVSAQLIEFEYGDTLRSYVIYEPELDPNPNGYPLVIGLHGTGSNAYQFIATAQLVFKANQEQFILACPNALEFGYFTYFNAGGGYEEMTDHTDDIGFITAVIDSMIANYQIDLTRIYVMGHSNGGMMSYRVAAVLSHRVAAMASNAGPMILPECDPEFPVPIIHIHGLSDSLVPYGGKGDSILVVPPVDSVIATWVGINDCSPIPDIIHDEPGILGKRWNSPDGNFDVELYIVDAMAHVWPRVDSLGISATATFWDFLEPHINLYFAPGLVAYYPFNGDANDESGKGNDGIVNGAVLADDRFNDQNSAYSFDGTDDYIEVPNSTSLILLDSMTLISWIKINSLNQFNIILRKGADNAGAGQTSYALYVRSFNELAFYFSSGGIHQSTGVDLVSDQWYFAAAVFDNPQDSVKLYINGDKVYSASEINDPVEYDFPLGIGKTNDPGQYFDGAIDDIRIYNTAFTDDEIRLLFLQESYILNPQNVYIEVISGNVEIHWDAVTSASSYSVYSSEDPQDNQENWILEAEGITNTNWSEPASEVKKFYYIKTVF